MAIPTNAIPGQPVALEIEYTGSDAGTDPTTLTLYIRDPDGAETPYTYPADIERVSAGLYRYVFSTVGKGRRWDKRWSYRWEATGAGATAQEGSFFITATPFAG